MTRREKMDCLYNITFAYEQICKDLQDLWDRNIEDIRDDRFEALNQAMLDLDNTYDKIYDAVVALMGDRHEKND